MGGAEAQLWFGRVELNGAWRVAPADDDLRRDAIGLDVDDSGWSTIHVPGHWRNHPAFTGEDGF